MFNLTQLSWLLASLLLLAGCATQPGKSSLESTSVNRKDSQQIARDLEKMYRLARKYQDEAQFAEAITTYENMLAIDPNYAEAHNGLGVIYSIQGDFDPALQHLQQAVALAPLASHLHNNLGYTYLLLGRKSEAISAFEQALRLDPENLHARANLTAIRNQTETTGE